MNKKFLIAFLVLGLSLAAFFLAGRLVFRGNDFDNYIFGKIVALENGRLTVEGSVTQKTGEEVRREENKTIIFQLKPSTEYIKKTILLGSSTGGSEPYQPDITESEGDLNDLRLGLLINVSSNSELLENNEADAITIIYPSESWK